MSRGGPLVLSVMFQPKSNSQDMLAYSDILTGVRGTDQPSSTASRGPATDARKWDICLETIHMHCAKQLCSHDRCLMVRLRISKVYREDEFGGHTYASPN